MREIYRFKDALPLHLVLRHESYFQVCDYQMVHIQNKIEREDIKEETIQKVSLSYNNLDLCSVGM